MMIAEFDSEGYFLQPKPPRHFSAAARRYLEAARVPEDLQPGRYGDWKLMIERLPEHHRHGFDWQLFTILQHKVGISLRTLHRFDDDCDDVFDTVMEDSPRELAKHLPIWMAARGRVLITGLGLGCVVRGLLASPKVEHIDVIEIDDKIVSLIGERFEGNHRVTIHHADALTHEFPPGVTWDYAWHDLWLDENENSPHLQGLHASLLVRYADRIKYQGAWAYPRFGKQIFRRSGFPYLG